MKAARIEASEIAEAKSVDLPSLIGAHVALKRRGAAFWGRCPFHKEKTPSFKVEKEFYICFGCGKKGDAISWIREAEHLSFEAAVRRLSRSDAPARFCGIRTKPSRQENDDAKRRRRAALIWEAAQPIRGTLADEYLRFRGIRNRQSAELRFAPAVEHTATKASYPALIARVSGDDGFCAVQRTYLARDKPAKADVSPNKMTLGPMDKGAVRLFPVGERLGLAEGVETALSASQLYAVPCWATLSAGRLAAVEIPADVRVVVIFADAGKVGIDAAFKAQDEYESRGYRVEVITPQAHFSNPTASDFNDLVRGD